ncbi:MAG: Gfo/Idh/MocA family oxidoreductase [Thermoguttaceae bacterium]|jgi:predicted dehydrogenase|nr:Gfo/Idh/MocA family oxidoreductase [Thermoguttaceae bacterium]
MSKTERREFLRASATSGLAVATTSWLATRPARAARPDKRVKVGQIGVGHAHAGGKMATLRKLADEFEVVGVAEPSESLREQWRDHPVYRGVPWMSIDQLLGTKGLQAVAVETEVRDLLPTAARCIAADMHIHLDKPAGESLPRFREVLDEATRRRLAVQMGYMYRNNPAFQFCFQAVRDGWLGRITEVHGVMSKMSPPEERKPMLPYAGGVLFELGCHLIDPLLAVMGKPDRISPFARQSRPELDVLADTQLAVLEYPHAIATIRATVVEAEGGRRRQFVVAGDEGTVSILPLEPPRLTLALTTPRGEFGRGYHEVTLPPMPGRYDEQLRELASIVRGEMANPYPPEHDLAAQEAILLASGLPLVPAKA